MEGANAELAQQMLARARDVNVMQVRVEVDQHHTRNARWVHLNEHQLPLFPHITVEYLKELTVGVYQVQLAASYIQDKLQRGEEELQMDEL